MSIRSLAYQHSVFKSDITVISIFQSFTYKMVAKISWHRYETKLRHCHCHPMYTARLLLVNGRSVIGSDGQLTKTF